MARDEGTINLLLAGLRELLSRSGSEFLSP
jgi:hypothetical protein